MAGYTKLFGSIVSSTIWNEADHVRLVWVTMLALADQYGRVEASVPGLAHQARVSVELTRAAIIALESPDPDSRTPDNEGRRIAKMDGGWRLLNHGKYREKQDEEAQKARNAERQARHREKTRNAKRNAVSRDVTQNNPIAEAEAYAKASISTKATPPAVTLPAWIPADSWNSFAEMRKKLRAPLTDDAIKLTISKLENLRAQGHDPGAVLDQSVERAWRGVFAVKQENGNGKIGNSRLTASDERNRERARALKEFAGEDDEETHGPGGDALPFAKH